MKKLLVAVAIVASIAACKSQTKSSVSDAGQAGMKADSCMTKDGKGCEGMDPAACADMKKSGGCGSMKAGADGKVCPVTGKPMN